MGDFSMATQVLSPFPFFTDRNGAPLSQGYVYIGVANQDPELFPQAVYWDAALTIPAAQPLRTDNGYVVNGSTPSAFYVAGSYSIRVRDKNAALVFYRATITDPLLDALALPSGAGSIGFDPEEDYDAGTAGAFLQELDQPSTGFFYAEQGARIQRLRDRLFVGGACLNNGTNVGAQPDWLTTYLLSKGRLFAFQQVSTMAVLNEGTPAGNAILAGARTSQLNFAGNGCGVLGVAVSNNAAHYTGAYGLYGEGFLESTSIGHAYGAELDIINFKAYAVTNPYSQAPQQTIGLQIASGAEFTSTFDASAAINVQANGAKFGVGLNFGATSLRGTDGTGTGTALAILMARGHGIGWQAASGQTTTQIFSVSSATDDSTTVNFNENSTDFLNTGTGKGVFAMGNIGATAVNFIKTNNSATGNPVQITAQGDDATIDIQLVPKGAAGRIWLGPWTASGDVACNGYISIKSADGTVRKVMTTT